MLSVCVYVCVCVSDYYLYLYFLSVILSMHTHTLLIKHILDSLQMPCLSLLSLFMYFTSIFSLTGNTFVTPVVGSDRYTR